MEGSIGLMLTVFPWWAKMENTIKLLSLFSTEETESQFLAHMFSTFFLHSNCLRDCFLFTFLIQIKHSINPWNKDIYRDMGQDKTNPNQDLEKSAGNNACNHRQARSHGFPRLAPVAHSAWHFHYVFFLVISQLQLWLSLSVIWKWLHNFK